MYKIVGADQKEYGPVSADQIRQWITQGRVTPLTKVQAVGGDWKTLGDFPEFSTVAPSSTPPIPPASPQATYAPIPPGKTSGMAITSLVLGILGIFSCGLTAVVGMVLGIVAMRRVSKSNGDLRGYGIALAGTIVSAVFLFLAVPLGAAMLLPALSKAKERAQSIQCVNNLKQLSLSAFIYADSHDGHLPPAETWADELAKLSSSKRVLVCPAAPDGDECDYAINSLLVGTDLHKAHFDTVLFFETANSSNPSGGSNLMLDRPRHGKTINVAFADGHIEVVKADRLASLRWEP